MSAVTLGADGARDFLRRMLLSDVTDPSVLYPDSLVGLGALDRERDLF